MRERERGERKRERGERNRERKMERNREGERKTGCEKQIDSERKRERVR